MRDIQDKKTTPLPIIRKEERCTLGSTVIKPFAIGINRMAKVKIVLSTLPKYSPLTLVCTWVKKWIFGQGIEYYFYFSYSLYANCKKPYDSAAKCTSFFFPDNRKWSCYPVLSIPCLCPKSFWKRLIISLSLENILILTIFQSFSIVRRALFVVKWFYE